jgi:hypothetical protein
MLRSVYLLFCVAGVLVQFFDVKLRQVVVELVAIFNANV